MLLTTYTRLIEKFPDVLYVIVGKGQYLAQLKRKTRELGLDDYVQFIGFVTDAELLYLYHRCEMFILLSVDTKRKLDSLDVEGFGMVFIEANLSGKPVVVGRSGGTTESISDGQSGLLVDALNREEVVESVMRLLSDPAYTKKLGESG